ncbi:transmembrane protein 150C isoform X3 [Polypterus senegalus]|uniref:transmembrane protein 150C isoform X3 n=1 Tax=Polypterus senegalus TaxID=55291 RepID=UPI00196385B7|nr:transmembrane protein 150C isoform X3 [Polypterus senegalus]
MKKFSIWMFLPLAFSVFTVAGLWIIYVIAIENNKIIPLNSKYMISESKYPPFISLAGNNPPASCVFSQVMNVSAFAAFVIGVFRYVQVKPKIIKPWINISSLTAFSLFCIGVSLIGNFQTDALDTGLGAMLSQSVNGIEHPIMYLSQKLLDWETSLMVMKRYTILEQEWHLDLVPIFVGSKL